MPRKSFLLLILWVGLLLSGCVPSMLGKQPTHDFNEQLYIDARLNFAIKHPLNWKRLQIPVSSPKYRTDTVRWEIQDLELGEPDLGIMLIRSRALDPDLQLPELLSSYLTTVPELKSGEVEEIELSSGAALKLLGHDDKHGRLTIATKGKIRDFIISLDYPSSRFQELLPIFNDIANSFSEVVQPTEQQQ